MLYNSYLHRKIELNRVILRKIQKLQIQEIAYMITSHVEHVLAILLAYVNGSVIIYRHDYWYHMVSHTYGTLYNGLAYTVVGGKHPNLGESGVRLDLRFLRLLPTCESSAAALVGAFLLTGGGIALASAVVPPFFYQPPGQQEEVDRQQQPYSFYGKIRPFL